MKCKDCKTNKPETCPFVQSGKMTAIGLDIKLRVGGKPYQCKDFKRSADDADD